MINIMKNFKLLALLCMLAFGFASCKEQQNEWRCFNGFTSQDVRGDYSASNLSEAFEGLTEGTYCRLCRDAQVKITNSGSRLRIEVKSTTGGLNWSGFVDSSQNDDDFLMQVGNEPDFLATVYTNDAKEVRLHGYVRRNHVNYYFDVIKN